MPQIMLQSVFIIRSYNDPNIEDGDLLLISFSVMASLISIANKYIFLDENTVTVKGKSLNPKMKFPSCFNYFYILRVVWRVSDVISKFAIYVLIWTVLGGFNRSNEVGCICGVYILFETNGECGHCAGIIKIDN